MIVSGKTYGAKFSRPVKVNENKFRAVDIRKYILYFFIVSCFIELLPHLEILIGPVLRNISHVKLLYAFSYFYIFLPLLFNRATIRLKELPALKWICLLIFVLVIGSMASIAPKIALFNIIRYLGYIFFYALLFFYLKTLEDIKSFLFIALLIGTTSFVLGHFLVPSVLDYSSSAIMEEMTSHYTNPYTGERFGRLYLLTYNANTVAYMSSSLMIVSLFFMIKRPKKGRTVVKLRFIYYLILG